MGIYVIKYEQNGESIWGIKKNEKVLTLKNQPTSLANLINNKSTLTSSDNLEDRNLSFEDLNILAPVSLPTKIICQGLNYASHRAEAALTASSKGNVMFSKDDSSITGSADPIVRPLDCTCLDYEVELGLIIGKPINKPEKIGADNLHEYVAGMLLANDMSPRDLQFREDYAQWFKGKSCRTMLPLGPVLYLTDKEDFDHLYNLKLQLWVNDELRQDSTTDKLIFKPDVTLSEISTFMNMNVGDILLTGTPGGVVAKAPSKFVQGMAAWLMTPQKKVEVMRKKSARYLQNGDTIKAQIKSIDGSIDLGVQQNTIVPYNY